MKGQVIEGLVGLGLGLVFKIKISIYNILYIIVCGYYSTYTRFETKYLITFKSVV